MKKEISVRMAILVSMLAVHLPAQTFTTLYNFDGGSDGSSEAPLGLILAGSTIYGTSFCCSSFLDPRNYGSLFAMNTDGSGFTTVYEFTGGFDGAIPVSNLILSGSTLYGTTTEGGSSGNGTVFAVNTNGTEFTTLYDFSGGNDGAHPAGGLTLSGNTLYGTTALGGSSSNGVIFTVNIDGTSFTNLYSFSATSALSPHANSDGANPGSHWAYNLTLSGKTLYGTASAGGSRGQGTVFAVNIDGTGFTNLHSFTGGADGANPQAGVILSGNILYGTTRVGGSSSKGTVFKLNTDGTGFATLAKFADYNRAEPHGPLALSGNTLYGTTYWGDISSPVGEIEGGTVFKVGIDGAGFTVLHRFAYTSSSPPYINDDGSHPAAGVVLSGNTLYGTTVTGGNSGLGTLFSISLPASPPQLAISSAAGNVILTWPTNAVGFQLESATDLSAGNTWSTVTDPIVPVGDQNTVTVDTASGRKFYQLRKQ